MDDSEIRRIANELDAAVTKDDVKLLIYYSKDNYGEHEDGSCELIGNRLGYLRAGIEMLKAALVPLGPGAIFTPINIDYLLGRGSLGVRRITRQEDVDAALPQPKISSWKNKVAVVGCLAVIVLFAICTVVGLFDVIVWFSRK